MRGRLGAGRDWDETGDRGGQAVGKDMIDQEGQGGKGK